MPVTQSQEVINADSCNFTCTAEGCTYSKRDMCGIVLHMRTHFVYETAKDAMKTATFVFKNGAYQCLDCFRITDNRLAFREHVRHHILLFPYKCKQCMVAVRSIPDLRKHSSAMHPKTPLQLSFEDTDRQLSGIMAMLGPEKLTLTFHHNGQQTVFTNNLGVHLDSCKANTSIASENDQFRVLKNNSQIDMQKTKHKLSLNGALNHQQLTGSLCFDMPGKFFFSEGKFKCITCSPWETTSEDVFKNHAWKHFHGTSGVCRSRDCETVECAFVLGLLTLLKNPKNFETPDTVASEMIDVLQTESDDAEKKSRQRLSLKPSSKLNFQNSAREKAPAIFIEEKEIENASSIKLTSSVKDGDRASFCNNNNQNVGHEIKPSKEIRTQSPDIHLTKLPRGQPAVKCLTNATEENVTAVSSKDLNEGSVNQLRFCNTSLFRLRSKACKLLDVNSIIGEDGAEKADTLVQGVECHNLDDQIDCEEMTAGRQLESQSCLISGPNSNSVSADEQKQEKSLDFCQFVHNSTPLSTFCDECSYTCNFSAQLNYHVESCHLQPSKKKKVPTATLR